MDGVLSQEEINALLNEPGAEASDSAENDSADGETADSDFPVDDADALPWHEKTRSERLPI